MEQSCFKPLYSVWQTWTLDTLNLTKIHYNLITPQYSSSQTTVTMYDPLPPDRGLRRCRILSFGLTNFITFYS